MWNSQLAIIVTFLQTEEPELLRESQVRPMQDFSHMRQPVVEFPVVELKQTVVRQFSIFLQPGTDLTHFGVLSFCVQESTSGLHREQLSTVRVVAVVMVVPLQNLQSSVRKVSVVWQFGGEAAAFSARALMSPAPQLKHASQEFRVERLHAMQQFVEVQQTCWEG